MRRLALLVCCLFVPAVARATVLVPIDFHDLVTTSSAIVHGRVSGVRCDWVDGRRAIQTFVTVEASEYLKGDLGRAVTFTVPGGRMGRYLTIFVGAPVFRVDDEVVLFLKTTAAQPVILGLSQGVMRVHDGVRGERVVSAPATIDDPAADLRAGSRRSAIPRRPVGLDRLRAAVRRVLAARQR
jgi:hypothetical protein